MADIETDDEYRQKLDALNEDLAVKKHQVKVELQEKRTAELEAERARAVEDAAKGVGAGPSPELERKLQVSRGVKERLADPEVKKKMVKADKSWLTFWGIIDTVWYILKCAWDGVTYPVVMLGRLFVYIFTWARDNPEQAVTALGSIRGLATAAVYVCCPTAGAALPLQQILLASLSSAFAGVNLVAAVPAAAGAAGAAAGQLIPVANVEELLLSKGVPAGAAAIFVAFLKMVSPWGATFKHAEPVAIAA